MKKQTTTTILDIPHECFGLITNYLSSPKEVKSLMLVSKFFYLSLTNPLIQSCINVHFEFSYNSCKSLSKDQKCVGKIYPFIHYASFGVKEETTDSDDPIFNIIDKLPYLTEINVYDLDSFEQLLKNKFVTFLGERVRKLNVYSKKFGYGVWKFGRIVFPGSFGNITKLEINLSGKTQYLECCLGTAFTKLRELTLTGNEDLSYVDSRFFHGLDLFVLDISFLYIPLLSDCFKTLDNLENLKIGSVKVYEEEKQDHEIKIRKTLPKLQTLEVMSPPLIGYFVLTDTTLINCCFALRKLEIGSTDFSGVHKFTSTGLDALKKVEHLSISSSHNYSNNDFLYLTSLKHLALTSRCAGLDNKSFTTLFNLEFFEVHGARFTSKVLVGKEKLKFFRNNLFSIDDLQNLKKIAEKQKRTKYCLRKCCWDFHYGNEFKIEPCVECLIMRDTLICPIPNRETFRCVTRCKKCKGGLCEMCNVRKRIYCTECLLQRI